MSSPRPPLLGWAYSTGQAWKPPFAPRPLPTEAAMCTEWKPSRHSVGGDRLPASQADWMSLMRDL
jgi:hypothetical protein